MRPRLKINQRRGSWVADVVGGAGAWRAVDRDDPRIAVILDDGSMCFVAREYRTYPTERHGAWWLDDAQAEWRTLLGEGRPFLLRTRAGDTEGGAAVAGRKVGVFRMSAPRLDADQFAFAIIGDRVGEAE